jgi:tetratricopeptide (TPR) repeat protein
VPKRTRSHILEDESRRAFSKLIPSVWVIRPLSSDYGIDDQVEVFEEDGRASSLMFLAQVKATDVPERQKALKVRLVVDRLLYYRQLDLPVMIVRFHSPTKKFYWRWVYEFTEWPKDGAKTVSLSLPLSAEWTDGTPNDVVASLKVFRDLKAPQSVHPITFSIAVSDERILDTPSSLVKSAILDAARSLEGVVRLTEENPAGSHPEVVISNEKLIVNLAGLRSLTMRLDRAFPSDYLTAKFPHDVMTAIAFVLAKAGKSSEAVAVGRNHLALGTMVENKEVTSAILGAMASAHRLADALNLVRQLLANTPRPHLAQWFLIVIRLYTKSLSASEVKELRELMQLLIDKAEESGNKHLVSAMHYNSGNHLRGQGWPHQKDAFKEYRLAAKWDPGYRKRPYFWKEIGGVLHGLSRFRSAATAYQRAIELGGDVSCYALRADSLMYSGRFRESLGAFRVYVERESEPRAEWLLKLFALEHIVEKLGIENQKRDSAVGMDISRLSDSADEKRRDQLEATVRADALCSFAWFNLGAIYGAGDRSEDALVAYLIAAVSTPQDSEAWCRAFGYAFIARQTGLLLGIAQTAYQYNGQDFLRKLEILVAQQSPNFPRTELLNIVGEAVKGVDRLNRMMEVREIGLDGAFRVVLHSKKGSSE